MQLMVIVIILNNLIYFPRMFYKPPIRPLVPLTYS